MDLARLHPVSLFAVWITLTAALVEPPVNVTLDCRNLTNILKWDYKQLTPGIVFRVHIQPYGGDAETFVVVPPDLQAELPPLIDPREEFYVTVTAVSGEEESEPGPPDGITFSYSQETLVGQKCFMDLPAVNVTTQPHNLVEFRFEHPWLLYRPKLRDGGKSKFKKRRSHDAKTSERLPLFIYKVMVVNQEKLPHTYECEESVCTRTLPVSAAKKQHCLKINGEMNLMSVQSDQEYCAQPGEVPSYGRQDYIYVIVGVLVLISLAAVGFMFYRKKTRPSSSTPGPSFLQHRSLPRQIMRPFPDDAQSVQEVLPASPTPLLTPRKEQNGREFTFVPDDDMRFTIGVTPEEDEGVSDVTEREEPNVDGSEYMGGRHMEDDETGGGRSAYERRSPVMVELAPGETAEGYRA